MKTALVVGDSILDRYYSGLVTRVSPEAPCPVVDVTDVIATPGGAANVAMNIASLTCPCAFVTALSHDGEDVGTLELQKWFNDQENLRLYAFYGAHAVAIKTRVTDELGRQIVRFDEQDKPRSYEARDEFVLTTVTSLLTGPTADDYGCLVLSDYGRGMLTNPDVVKQLIQLANKVNIPSIVDPKSLPFSDYAHCTLLKPNAARALRELASDSYTLRSSHVGKLATSVCLQGTAHALLVTDGRWGMYLVSKLQPEPITIPAYPVDALVDVTGAGDAVVACLAHDVCAEELSPEDFVDRLPGLARRASVGGGVAASFTRTVPLTLWHWQAALAKYGFINKSKVITLAETELRIQYAHDEGKRVVFTNGCFDMLHPGHVNFLIAARRKGDMLIVGVNEDAMVTKLKGPGRPVYNLVARCKMLAALECVDYIVPFADPAPDQLLIKLRPDVFIKGAEYKDRPMPGVDIVTMYGGLVTYIDMCEEFSTTKLIEKLRA